MPRDSRESIATEVEQAVAPVRPDVEIVDVQFVAPQQLVRVLVDHPDGVDHALCQDVTTLLAGVRERYSLEVSSPGVERPLTKPAHYRRAEGEVVKVRLRAPREGRRNFQGRLTGADEDSFRLLADGAEVELPYAAVDKCNIVWDPVKV